MTAVPFNTKLKAEIITELDEYAQSAAEDAAASAVEAADSVGAVKQVISVALQPDAGLEEGSWYADFFRSTTTEFTKLRFWIYLGTGSCDLYINVDNVNVLGPISVSTTASSETVSITVPVDSSVAIQISDIVGTPMALSVQLEGLPV